jgi:hypothetical protein
MGGHVRRLEACRQKYEQILRRSAQDISDLRNHILPLFFWELFENTMADGFRLAGCARRRASDRPG